MISTNLDTDIRKAQGHLEAAFQDERCLLLRPTDAAASLRIYVVHCMAGWKIFTEINLLGLGRWLE